MVPNDVPLDDLHLYLFGVVGSIEQLLGHPSQECRQMAAALGAVRHEMLGDQHVRNGQWSEAEHEFRLAQEIACLSPDGIEVAVSLTIADMMRVQGHHSGAKQLFRETLDRFEQLDERVRFHDRAKHLSDEFRSQLDEYLRS